MSKEISILHLANDEKFINAANYIFEKAFPGSNHFIIVHNEKFGPPKYVKQSNNLEIVNINKKLIELLASKTKEYTIVLLHGIFEFNSSVFLKADNKNKFIGLFWGAEIYNQKNIYKRPILGELSLVINKKIAQISYLEKAKNILRNIIYNTQNDPNILKCAIAQIPYFGIIHKEEFNLFQEKGILSKNCKYIPFTYYPLEYINKGFEECQISDNNILLGNSALATNNHLEAFEKLKRFDLGSRKLILPLSYGNLKYGDIIEKTGKSIFGNNLIVLKTFMPLHEYNYILQSCGIVIMNQYRQQAVGNILSSLWLGAKVYLNESNTIFPYLKRIGIEIYSIENDFHPENPTALENLSINVISKNKEILLKEIGEQAIILKLREYLNKYFFNNITIPQ